MRVAALAAVAAGLAPAPATAHLVGVEFGDFYAGALHVLTGVEHVAGLVAICLLAALQPKSVGRWALVAAPASMLLGAMVAFVGAAQGEGLALAALALLGGAAALGLRASTAALVALVAFCGVTHGYVNGRAAATAALTVDWRLYVVGVASVGALTVTLGTAAMSRVAGGPVWAPVALRAVGSWIAALGLVMAALGLAT